MRRCLLLLIIPLLLCADDGNSESGGGTGNVRCYVRFPGGDGDHSQIEISCFPVWVDPDGTDTKPMDPVECENIKNTVLTALNSVLGDIRSAKDAIVRYYDDWDYADRRLDDLQAYIDNNQSGFGNYYPPLVSYTLQIETNLQAMAAHSSQSMSALTNAEETVNQAVVKVNQLSCVSAGQDCNPQTGTCACTDQLNAILNEVRPIGQRISSIETSVLSIEAESRFISSCVSNIAETCGLITRRLTAPDDRMWGDIQDLYDDIKDEFSYVLTNRIDFSEIFYTIKRDIEDAGLEFSTEGVVQLFSAALAQRGFVLQQGMSQSILAMNTYYSNLVSRLFRLYNDTMPNNVNIPQLSRYSNIYNAFTNTSLNPRSRFVQLSQTGLGVSNWFTRIEFYNQALLGWFHSGDDLSELVENQESASESTINERMVNTTNTLGTVSESGVLATNLLGNVLTPVSDGFKLVEIQAFMPTIIEILPEIEVGPAVFGPVAWDTSGFQEYADVCRNVTSLVWRVSFWCLWVGLAIGAVRIVFLLALYAIHFYQNL